MKKNNQLNLIRGIVVILLFIASTLVTVFAIIALTEINLFSVIYIILAYSIAQEIRKLVPYFDKPIKLLSGLKKFYKTSNLEIKITMSLAIITVVLTYVRISPLMILQFLLTFPLFAFNAILFQVDIFFRYSIYSFFGVFNTLFTIFLEVYFLYVIAKLLVSIIGRFKK